MFQFARADDPNAKYCCDISWNCTGCLLATVKSGGGGYVWTDLNPIYQCRPVAGRESSSLACVHYASGVDYTTNPPTYSAGCFDEEDVTLYTSNTCASSAGTGTVWIGMNYCTLKPSGTSDACTGH